VLEVDDLRVYYDSVLGQYRVVDGVSLQVREKEIFGIAGESGCGKSTLAEAILRLVKPPGYIKSGTATLEGVDLVSLSEDKLREIRWKKLSYIPQGSMNSLNPVLKIEEQMIDVIRAHSELSKDEARKLSIEALDSVGLPSKVLGMYPHELSGGMKQRVCIATAMTLKPIFVVADEPVTALDVTIQRMVLESIAELRKKYGVTILLIAHDMAVHAEIDDRLAIMYAGKIMEVGSVYDIFDEPVHPYTKALLDSVPSIEKKSIESGIPGLAPSPLSWPSGCRFHPRCPHARAACSQAESLLREIEDGHFVACDCG